MPGPNGEQCGTCYYFDQIQDGPEGYCRHENADSWVEARGDASQRLWPRVDADKDWSGDWADRNAPISGIQAIGAYVTPTGTTYSITDAVNFSRFNPPGLIPGALMFNTTLVNGQLQVNIPGSFDIGTQWAAEVSIYGSVNFPNQNTFFELTPTSDDVIFNTNVRQKLSVNPQTDDLDLAFSMAGVGVGAPVVNFEVGVRGDIGNAIFASFVAQIRVTRL